VGAEDQARFGVRVVAVLTAETYLVGGFRGAARYQNIAAERPVGVVDRLRERGAAGTADAGLPVGVPEGLGLNDVALGIVELSLNNCSPTLGWSLFIL
jgi:hypothetical protein